MMTLTCLISFFFFLHQPLWVLKTVEKHRQRLVHMSPDLARQLGLMLENFEDGAANEVLYLFIWCDFYCPYKLIFPFSILAHNFSVFLRFLVPSCNFNSSDESNSCDLSLYKSHRKFPGKVILKRLLNPEVYQNKNGKRL